MSIYIKNKNVSRRRKQSIKQHNRIREYKYQIIINGAIACFISFIIYAFLFAIPRGRSEPRFHLSQQENIIIYIIIFVLPIITIIATSIFSFYRISKVKNGKK